MIRSLRTGVSGLKTHQARMDVVGNNIANANTVGYKRSRAVFNEVLGQKLLGLSRSSGSSGITSGIVGYGSAVGSVGQNWSQGPLEFSNIPSDLAFNGDGFFVARSTERLLLTRAGDFIFDEDGTLVTSGGLPVQGYAVDANGDVDVSRLSDISIDYSQQEAPQSTTNVVLANNLSADTEVGETVETQTGVYDDQGKLHSVNIRFTKTADNAWDYEVRYTGDATPPPFSDTTGSLSFNVDGSLATTTPITVNWDAGYVGANPSFDIDVSALTQYSRLSNALVVDRNGHSSGSLESYNIESDGSMWLNFTNGERRQAFQLVVGNVGNLQALENVGENFYATTPASGDLTLGRAGREINTVIVSGALEQSNTDLATEFTDMIVAQRGYQASARVITTSDELLQEVVQLKR